MSYPHNKIRISPCGRNDSRWIHQWLVKRYWLLILTACFIAAAPLALAESPNERWDREAALSAQSLRAGKFDEAEKHGREALAAAEAAVGKDHPDYAIALNNLAAVYSSAGKEAEAIQLLVHVTELFENTTAPGTLRPPSRSITWPTPTSARGDSMKPRS